MVTLLGDEIIVIEVGTPGIAGTGISAAEKASIDARLVALEVENALELAAARYPISVRSEYGGGTTQITDIVLVPNLTGTGVTLPAGTWAFQLVLTCNVTRNVTGDPAGGYGYVELRVDNQIVGSALPGFLFVPTNVPMHVGFAADITNVSGGGATFFIVAYFRGQTTAGYTSINELSITGVATRTA